ncbi:MAG: cytochrome b N-terminal domain-containing protein [Anaerolineales bacterium]|nr:cytochrome b N-terminal domain-containing protein [Anaerolineales bacterium]
MVRYLELIAIVFLAVGGILLASTSATASPSLQDTAVAQATPTFAPARLDRPATVFPPSQADIGAQTYWGMCMDCHGDHGQGLTEEWLNSYKPELRDCWQSGCHGADYPENSFEILKGGVPALSGPGSLARFSNAYELQVFIQENMPFFPTGSLTPDEAWPLTAYVMRLNDRQLDTLNLDEVNGSVIPVHRDVSLPGKQLPGVLILSTVLLLAAVGLAARNKLLSGESVPKGQRANFFHHLHPVRIPARQSRFWYTLGAGGLAVFLSLVLLFTGLLEMYYYIPTPDQAAVSVAMITTLVPFGSLVRNLHFWSAQFLVIVMTIHLLRVTLTGAYAPPRRFNYLLGLGLLVLILLLDFTGYVLRWDEGIRWALVVGTNLLKTIPWVGEALYRFVIGGDIPGSAALTRFYAWHIFGLTLGAGILIVWHAFRVRRDGGIAVSPPEVRAGKDHITRFELVRREGLAMVIAGLVLVLFSLAVPAPIAPPISDASAMTGDSRAPWFFLWIQQLLKFGDPFLWGVLVPVLVVVVLGLLPYLLPNAKADELGRWFPPGNRIAQGLSVLMILAILLLTVLGAFQ